MPQNLALHKEMSWLQIVDNQDCCKLCTVNRSYSALMCVCFNVLAFRARHSNIIIIIIIIIIIHYLLGAK